MKNEVLIKSLMNEVSKSIMKVDEVSGRYQMNDRRRRKAIEVEESLSDALERLGALLGYECITMSLDDVCRPEEKAE